MSDPLVIAGRAFASRLVVGTGKYASFDVMQAAHVASGTEMVTVAVRRVDLLQLPDRGIELGRRLDVGRAEVDASERAHP